MCPCRDITTNVVDGERGLRMPRNTHGNPPSLQRGPQSLPNVALPPLLEESHKHDSATMVPLASALTILLRRVTTIEGVASVHSICIQRTIFMDP